MDPELILPGDYPDPAIARWGDRLVMTHSSFRYAPGLQLWQSTDLAAWKPLGHALPVGCGDVWAPDLIEHGGRWFIYFHADGHNYVVHADSPAGPWSEPIRLGAPGFIDPGHTIDADGRRHLFLSRGRFVPLTADGLSLDGPPRETFAPCPMPADGSIEGVALEGPKPFWRDGWLHLLVAQGGTAGPATSHGIYHARARNVTGPWEYSPHNPLVRTASGDEPWWSRGHGSAVDVPGLGWWLIYHGYRQGFRTLGRQTLGRPAAWTTDGWLVAPDDAETQARRARRTADAQAPASRPNDDDLLGPALGWPWRFFDAEHVAHRFDHGLVLPPTPGSNDDTAERSLRVTLACMPVDPSYRVEVQVERLDEQASGGLMLWYNDRAYAGLWHSARGLHEARQGTLIPHALAPAASTYTLRLTNRNHELHRQARFQEGPWINLHGDEVSGFHHNVLGGFLSLRVALVSTGEGSVRFRGFRYTHLA